MGIERCISWTGGGVIGGGREDVYGGGRWANAPLIITRQAMGDGLGNKGARIFIRMEEKKEKEMGNVYF